MTFSRKASVATALSSVGLVAVTALTCAPGCSSGRGDTVYATTEAGAAVTATCASPPSVADTSYCAGCAFPAGAFCVEPRVVAACCVYTAAPSSDLARGTGLHVYSSTNAALDLACLATPPTAGVAKTATLTGHVRIFSTGGDSANVTVEVYTQGVDGALGDLVGTGVTTTLDDTVDPAILDTWSTSCPQGGCKLRSYSYPNVPTETPLIIKTSDASGTETALWADAYEYNVYVANTSVAADGTAAYDPEAVAANDVGTIAAETFGIPLDPSKGVLLGEVHDCGDVRLSGAMVDTSIAHDSPVFYFSEDEDTPIPEAARAPLGTSRLGAFGALNLGATTAIDVSAVGSVNGQVTLLGNYTVQAYPGAVTLLTFRGRRPFQK